MDRTAKAYTVSARVTKEGLQFASVDGFLSNSTVQRQALAHHQSHGRGLIILFPLLVLLLFWYHQAFKRQGQTEKMNVIGRNSTIALAVCALALFGASLLSRHL